MNEPRSFVERYLTASFRPPISPKEVNRLALEGGGGKGNAFVGALFGLEQLGILGNLEEVAGSSAGAITALALALGMRPNEILEFIHRTDFTKFFDASSDAVPTVGERYKRGADEKTSTARRAKEASRKKCAEAVGRKLSGATLDAKAILLARKLFKKLSDGSKAAAEFISLNSLLAANLEERDVGFVLAGLANRPKNSKEKKAAPVTPSEKEGSPWTYLASAIEVTEKQNVPDYTASLVVDMGLFSGEVARDAIADLIKERFGFLLHESIDGRTVTFRMLDELAKKSHRRIPKLTVTGSDVCSMRTVLFSSRTTADFPVADAVRISMGLPFIYKPYIIESTKQNWPPCGVYVDGGLYANLPFLAFSSDAQRSCLGLRLEIDAPEPVYGILGFALQVLKGAVFAGESSNVGDRADRSIILDTDPLSTIDFAVSGAALAAVTARSHITTMAYFGRVDKYRPVDLKTGKPLTGEEATQASKATWAELQGTIRRRQERPICVFDQTSRA
jgi:predicted acylesterase/phospholipase RssA